MNRKNDSKQTVNKILTISSKLFNEKGYENTSIQDIVNSLGMSKGAIFHHFKSKDEIFNEVMKRQVETSEKIINKMINEMNHLNGKEKLIQLFEKTIENQSFHALDKVCASRMISPHFVLAHMKDSIDNNAPIFAKIMYEGIEDGSITTEFPDECAEVFFLLINIWCDPTVFNTDIYHLEKRFKFLQLMMKNMGVDILHDELLQKCLFLIKKLYKENETE